MMKLTRLLLLICIFCCAKSAQAAVLRGVVSEVLDGQTIIVNANNRKLTLVLAGVDAPELKQEFGDVAQQHLASLILNKGVEVEIAELRMTSALAKVYCDRIDVALQMVRDGVAWYDPSTDRDLTELERRLYTEAQSAARNELRGIWHDGTPMPPWDWRRAKETRSTLSGANVKAASKRGLTSEDLITAGRSGTAVETGSNTNSKGPSSKSSAKPPSSSLNSPGQDLDFSSYLNNGRVSIAYFYADWCPACRGLTPVMANINNQVPDMQVLFLNIGEWNTPITQRYGITYVPYLRIYDKNGSLIAEGREANSWLQEEFRRRK
jgi:endonuclease YncB( thermonuclease family)/thiol-disulfide isomerase/thioredoxin